MQLLARAEQQSKKIMKNDFESNESDKSQKIKRPIAYSFFIILVYFHNRLIIKFDSSFSFVCYQKYVLTPKDRKLLLKWLEGI